MPLDLSAYDIELGDTRDLVEKLNNAHRAIEAGVNATEDTVTDRLDDQDAIIDGLAGAMTAGVTFKGTHSAAGGSYPAGPAAGDYWIISAAGTISGVYFNVGDSIVYYSSSWIRIPATPDMSAINPLTKAIRVAITAAASGSNGIQALSSVNLNMATNSFTPWVRKLISNTRPAANEVLDHKHDGVNGWIITLLTTGIIRLTLNGTNYDSTAALPSATNVIPLIMTPIGRETATVAGSVTFVVDGAQLGSALAISARAEKIVNGTFDTDLTGWTLSSGGTITWSSGKMRVERVSSNTSGYQAISLAAGETLFVSAAVSFVSGATADAQLSVRESALVSSTVLATSNELLNGASGTCRVSYYSATAKTVYLHALVYGSAGIYDFDTITSIDTASVDNTSNLYALGTSTTRTEGGYYEHGIYNRALTVAECLRHAVMGPDAADVASGTAVPSQTNQVNNGAFDSNLSGWTTGSNCTSSWDAGGEALISVAGSYTSSSNNWFYQSSIFDDPWKRYRITFDATYVSGASLGYGCGFKRAGTITAAENGGVKKTYTVEVVPNSLSGSELSVSFLTFFVNSGTGPATWKIDNVKVEQIGIVGWWNSQDAQSNTGQIFDRSGNKGHCVLPAAGATILPRPPRTFQVRSMHSWSETHELQYLTLVNQPVVPSTAKLVRIFGEVTSTGGSGPQDFIIGDGSDGDRYVVLTSGLTTGKKEFTIDTTYAGFNDGTNLKLTIDPDANCTMTVALVLVFENLE